MDRQAATAPDPQWLRAEFEALWSVAVAVLTAHVNDCGLCAMCGCGWPCERAALAERNRVAL